MGSTHLALQHLNIGLDHFQLFLGSACCAEHLQRGFLVVTTCAEAVDHVTAAATRNELLRALD